VRLWTHGGVYAFVWVTKGVGVISTLSFGASDATLRRQHRFIRCGIISGHRH
jgi:hypothetical protein